jgi:hypothetical protein
MTSIQVTVELPADVAAQADTLGLLSGEKIAELITAEVQRRRQAAADRLRETMDRLSQQFQQEYAHLSEAEALAMIQAWIDETDSLPDTR